MTRDSVRDLLVGMCIPVMVMRQWLIAAVFVWIVYAVVKYVQKRKKKFGM